MRFIHPNVYGRARPVLFRVANYLKTRTFTSIHSMIQDLEGVSTTQAGCCLRVLGWKKYNPKSRRGRYHR